MSLVVGIRSVCMWRLLFLYLLILFLIFHFQFLSNPDLVTIKTCIVELVASSDPSWSRRRFPRFAWLSCRVATRPAPGWSHVISNCNVQALGTEGPWLDPVASASAWCFPSWAVKWSQPPEAFAVVEEGQVQTLVLFLSRFSLSLIAWLFYFSYVWLPINLTHSYTQQ